MDHVARGAIVAVLLTSAFFSSGYLYLRHRPEADRPAGYYIANARSDKPGIAPVPSARPVESPASPVTTDNSNALVKRHLAHLIVRASTSFNGWEPNKAIDGLLGTSWFSESGDRAGEKGRPWIDVIFPEEVAVSRVTVLGNRDPVWTRGHAIERGRVELADANGTVLWTRDTRGRGEALDHDVHTDGPVRGVRIIRFTSLADQALDTQFHDVGVGEIQVE